MLYRVAWITKDSAVWQWKSTTLSSHQAVFGFLQLYRAIPKNRLRVFASSSAEDLDAQLEHENIGSEQASLTAAVPLPLASMSRRSPPMLEMTDTWQLQRLDQRRLEIELGAGGDVDLPFMFALPANLSETLAWIQLLARVQRGELEP